MKLGSTRNNSFDNNKYLEKIVYVIGFDFKGVQQDYDIYDNYNEALENYNNLKNNNIDKTASYTFDKCIVHENELETIENY